MTRSRFPSPRHVLAAFAVALATGASQAGGLDIHADGDARDVGLPAYPGAVKNVDSDSDTAGFTFGVWGRAFGFRLAVASYRSADGVEAVAAFYRDAMRAYGPVLDCTGVHAKPRPHGDDKGNQDKPVSCDDDRVEDGGRLFKVGTNRAQRVFKVTPMAQGSKFELVRVEMHGSD